MSPCAEVSRQTLWPDDEENTNITKCQLFVTNVPETIKAGDYTRPYFGST